MTFGKEKKFFSEIDESEGECVSEEGVKEQVTTQKQSARSRERSTMGKSREKEPLAERNTEDVVSRSPSYLLNHVKKKLNYNSMSSCSNSHFRERENSYSSREKMSSGNINSSSREDRYKLLIRNILNIKEK